MLDVKKLLTKILLYLIRLAGIGTYLYGDGSDNYEFKSGSKTIPNISNYALLAIKPRGAATWILAYNLTGNIRGCGAVSTGSHAQLYACNLSRSGNTVTYGSLGWTYADGNNGYSNVAEGISCIVGLLPKLED